MTDAQRVAVMARVVEALMGPWEEAHEVTMKVRRLKAAHGVDWVEYYDGGRDE